VEALVAVGVDLVVVDTAHGHSMASPHRAEARKKYPKLDIMAGNGDRGGRQGPGRRGVDAVKVGVGPGSSAPPAW
jgi:IMP dehydrogenase